MPTIHLKKKDLDSLLGRSVTLPELEDLLPLVKGELKDYEKGTGEIKLELNDTNRPDLWCVEGVARQIKTHRTKKSAAYSFYHGKRKTAGVIHVDPKLKKIRPYIGACVARGLTLNDDTLAQLIQTQEKLSESFGRKRRLVSIGLYRLARITFPVSYKAVRPDSVQFVPLGFESPMSPADILKKHPKGVAYAGVLGDAREVPILVDSKDRILSFAPIINSRELGEVQAGDRDLFVEVTGTDLRMVMLTVNILAANLADRGAAIAPVEVRYPYLTDFGRKIVMPSVLAHAMTVRVEEFSSALGVKLKASHITPVLKAYGYQVSGRGESLKVSVPAYRDDLLHPMDVVEDFAISRGYESFEPEMPSEFTVGGLSSEEQYSDRIRDSMCGMGFQEIVSNILTNREDSIDRMNRTEKEGENLLVSVANVMSQTYSALRDGIIPSLLRVEAASSKSFYPHKIFEAGETAQVDEKADEGTSTFLKLAALLAHPIANFSELHSSLDLLMYYLDRSYKLVPVTHPSFLEGRVGKIVVEGKDLGLIGELHPKVLNNWQIVMPCTVFELRFDLLVR